MSRSAIDQLRDANPHPRTLPAPPIETVLGRLGERPGTRDGGLRSRGRRWGVLVSPLITTAVVVGVLVLVLTSVHSGPAGHNGGHSGVTAVGQPADVTPAGPVVAPRRGMPGTVYSLGATALAPDSSGIVSLQQCLGCKSNGNHTPRSHSFDWLLSTNAAGSGTLTRTPYLLTYPQLSGQNGWASGIQSNGRGAGDTAEFYVSHDRGRHWSVAPSAAPNGGNQQVSLGFGEVWSVGQPRAATVVLHAPASGSRLLATTAQPTHGMLANAQVVAAGPSMAYLYNANTRGLMYLTRDDGRSWQPVTPPCPAGELGRLANGASGNAVWVVCARLLKAPVPRNAHLTLARSTDGGRHWTDLPTPFSARVTPIISPVSASVIWAQNGAGAVLRSTNAGATWQSVWSLAQQAPGLRSTHLPGTYPGDLIAQSPQSATMQLSLVHGRPGSATAYTNLVRYHTTNGGRTWRTKVISLAVR